MVITRNSKRKQEPIKIEQFRKALKSRNWNQIAKLSYRDYATQAIYNIQKKLQIVNQRDGKFRLRKNNYPYFWEIGWLHFILWYHETQESTMVIEDLNIINRIQRQFPKALIWQNP
jgi:Fe-S cluster biosynthesis and repair protein YggX